MFVVDEKVKIKKNLSKASYYLYQDYRRKSPLIVCPCALKCHVVKIKKIIDNNIVLCSYEDKVITILYIEDLEKVAD